MRGWIAALLGLGVVVAGCGGEEERTAAAKPEMTSTGGERAAAVIEVDESALRAPSRVEIVEMVPVPVPAPIAPSAQAEMEAPETDLQAPEMEAQAQAPGVEMEAEAEAPEMEMEMDRPSAQTPSAQAELEAPSEDTPIAEVEIEGEANAASAQAAAALCPNDIPGLHATSRNTRNGAVLTLTTTRSSEVPNLRSRARELASMLDRERAACAIDEEGQPVQRASHFLETESAIHQVRDIRLTDVPRGVRIEFVGFAEERELVNALHTQVAEDARSLREGLCPLSFQTI